MARGLIRLAREQSNQVLKLNGVASAAIGEFRFGLLALVNVVLLAGITLAEESRGLVRFGSFDRRKGSFVGMTVESKFHAGGSVG